MTAESGVEHSCIIVAKLTPFVGHDFVVVCFP